MGPVDPVALVRVVQEVQDFQEAQEVRVASEVHLGPLNKVYLSVVHRPFRKDSGHQDVPRTVSNPRAYNQIILR